MRVHRDLAVRNLSTCTNNFGCDKLPHLGTAVCGVDSYPHGGCEVEPQYAASGILWGSLTPAYSILWIKRL